MNLKNFGKKLLKKFNGSDNKVKEGRLTIKKKLIIALGSLLLVFIIFGLYSISGMRQLYKKTDNISKLSVNKINIVNTISNSVYSLRAKESELIVETFLEERGRLKKELHEVFEEFDAAVSKYTTIAEGNEDKKLVEELQSNLATYKVVNAEIINLVGENKISGAVNLSKGKSKNTYRKLLELSQDLRLMNITSINRINADGERLYGIMLIASVVVIILLTGFVTATSLWLIFSITKPINNIKERFSELSQRGGDLTHDIVINTADEIGEFSRSVNNFIQYIRRILIQINRSSDDMLGSANNVSDYIRVLNRNVNETNKALIEITEGITETSATAQQVTASSMTMESLVDKMEERGRSASAAAGEIAVRASELQANAKKSNEETIKVYADSKRDLESALVQSKAVEDINNFSKIIFNIAQQINLLSLNASIEAARVGEAGKGFTVVAEEIRKLAETSKTTVQDIRNTTEEVISAVHHLAISSKNILNFMDTTVLHDYQNMHKVGVQYNLDAVCLNSLMKDISNIAEQLSLTVGDIIKSMNSVADTVSLEAQIVQDIEVKSGNIAEEVNLIQKQTSISEENAVVLKELISRFKV